MIGAFATTPRGVEGSAYWVTYNPSSRIRAEIAYWMDRFVEPRCARFDNPHRSLGMARTVFDGDGTSPTKTTIAATLANGNSYFVDGSKWKNEGAKSRNCSFVLTSQVELTRLSFPYGAGFQCKNGWFEIDSDPGFLTSDSG